jgi:hypothetical protein
VTLLTVSRQDDAGSDLRLNYREFTNTQIWKRDAHAKRPNNSILLSDGRHEARRLEQERDATVRRSASWAALQSRITFQLTRNLHCSNPTLAATSSLVRGAIVVATARK